MKKLIAIIFLGIFFLSAQKIIAAECGGCNTVICSPGDTCPSQCPNQAPLETPDPPLFRCIGSPTGGNTQTTGTASLGFICGLGPLGEFFCNKPTSDVTPASNLLASVLSGTIGILTIVAGFWFMLQILLAGFSYISAGGAKEKIQESQHKITNSVIGLIIVVAAYALTSLFGKILGISNILDIGAVIKNIGQSIKP